jgi:hypothetical protein
MKIMDLESVALPIEIQQHSLARIEIMSVSLQ